MGEQADGGAHDLVVSRPSETTRGAVEVLDPSFDYWLARFEVADNITPGPGERAASPAAVAALSAMVARLPELQIMLGQTNVLRVVFSPEIQRALASGQATLMQSAQFALPVAVNHSGQIMGMARVAGGTGTKAGGGLALGSENGRSPWSRWRAFRRSCSRMAIVGGFLLPRDAVLSATKDL